MKMYNYLKCWSMPKIRGKKTMVFFFPFLKGKNDSCVLYDLQEMRCLEGEDKEFRRNVDVRGGY